jgi:Rrf2 family protein
MQITKAGEYGVLGVMNLARRGSGQMVMIEDVSREEGIPRSFLGKIFQNLVRAGIVRSTRGAGGGMVLARTPESITVLEVIEAIEGRIALQRCLQETPDCNLVDSCALCGILGEAQDRMRDVLAHATVADLLKNSVGTPRKPVAGVANTADVALETVCEANVNV